MKVVKGIFNTIINILIVLVLVVSVLVATLALTSKSSGISTVFGYTIQVVMSDSMDGGSPDYEGGDFKSGDVIIGKATKFDLEKTYEEGDIVTYKGYLQGNEHLGEQLICHRIVDVAELNGYAVYQTQGDNRQVSQLPDQEVVERYLTADKIGAVFYSDDYQGTVLKGVGKVYEFINSQLGFFLCILLPMIFFFLYVLIKVVINAVQYKAAKAQEENENNKSNDADSSAPQMSAQEYEQFKQFMAFKKAQEVSETSDKIETEETSAENGEEVKSDEPQA